MVPPVAKRPPPATTLRPAPGYADTTPPPPIDAVGTDYAAIATSLLTYKSWLYAHHPDPALAAQVFQLGTAAYEGLVADLTTVRARHQTVASVDQRLTFKVVGVYGSLMTMRLRETLVEDQWFDGGHRVVRTDLYPEPNHFVVAMTNDGAGRWRIADITPVPLDPAIVITR